MFFSKAATKMPGGGQARLTAASTNMGKPLDANSIPYLHVRVLCSWPHLDDDSNALMATDLECLLAHPFVASTRAGLNNLTGLSREWQLRPSVQHDSEVTVAYS